MQTDPWKVVQSVSTGDLREVKHEGSFYFVYLYLTFSSMCLVFKQNRNTAKNNLPSFTDHPVLCSVAQASPLIPRAGSQLYFWNITEHLLVTQQQAQPPLSRMLSGIVSEGNATLPPGAKTLAPAGLLSNPL